MLGEEKLKDEEGRIIDGIIDGVIEKVMADPKLLEKAEEYQKKYGTMSEADLIRQFTI